MTTRCFECSTTCRTRSRSCVDGWKAGRHVPDPFVALAARPYLTLARLPIPEPGRYYDGHRAIVLRAGMLLEEQRRHLWHELVHADRRDQACHGSQAVEASVEREAVRRAMPLGSLEWAMRLEWERHHVAGLLRLPEEWVQFRLTTAHPRERMHLREVYGVRRTQETCEEESA